MAKKKTEEVPPIRYRFEKAEGRLQAHVIALDRDNNQFTGEQVDIVKIIKDRLKQVDKTVYWLSQQQSKVHPKWFCNQIYAGKVNFGSELIEEILLILALKIVPVEPEAKK